MEGKDTAGMEKGLVTSIITAKGDRLNAEEAGELFGVSAWAMYKRVKKGYVPFHNMGNRIYFKRSELMELL
jgi:excisionase family DNA binding protein